MTSTFARLCLVLASSLGMYAAADDSLIESASANIDQGFITVRTTAPISGPITLALLGQAEPLKLISAADRIIKANLPVDTPHGNYRLRVHGLAPERSAEIDVVVGIVGPFLDEKH